MNENFLLPTTETKVNKKQVEHSEFNVIIYIQYTHISDSKVTCQNNMVIGNCLTSLYP